MNSKTLKGRYLRVATNKDLIGTIRYATVSYWNTNEKRMKFKGRPILILAVESEVGLTDLSVVPLSKISDVRRISKTYDIELSIKKLPDLKLSLPVSYLRTSKLTTVNLKEVSKSEISNLKTSYPEFFEQVLKLVKQYVNSFK